MPRPLGLGHCPKKIESGPGSLAPRRLGAERHSLPPLTPARWPCPSASLQRSAAQSNDTLRSMAKLQELTVEANLGASQDGSIARAVLSPEGLRITIAKGDSIREITLDSQEQIEALSRIFDTHRYAKIG